MVTADATDLPLDKIFLLYQCPIYYFLVFQSMVVVGQTIPSIRPTRRTQNLGPKYTAMVVGMILNNAHALSAGNFIYARIIMHKPYFSGPALLSCSKFLTYQLLGSQLWIELASQKSRSPETRIEVPAKSRHNSRINRASYSTFSSSKA